MRYTIKRTTAYLLVLVLALSMAPVCAFADGEAEDVTAVSDLLFNGEMIAEESDTADNDELFMQYVEAKLSEGIVNEDDREITGHVRLRRVMPSGINAAIYASLKEQVKLVADGKKTMAVFDVTLEELALEKNSWTAEELGVPAIAVNGSITQEAKNALTKELGINLRSVLTALLFDCPYDLYWYDKEGGVSISGPGISAERGESGWQIFVTSGITVCFEVADGYSTGNDNEVDPSKAERVEGAVNNAKAIVKEAEGETDHGKLVSYKEAICSLVEYDQEAAADISMPYGDPWQVISVFDEDETTNVVCEGYSKAFQYLCDLTDFESDLDCISVSGTMSGGTGSGAHMWNILCMGDGKNYLADITNCDEGTVGSPDKLFIAGYAGGDVSSGYIFSCTGGTIKYYYDSETTSAFDDELIIAPKGSCPHDLIRSDEIPATCTVDGVREYWTCTMCEGLFGDANATEVLEQADIIIPAGHKEEVMPAMAATCTETGLTEGLRCSVCGEILIAQEVVPAKGHVEEILPAREAACEVVGLTEGKKCSVCGAILEPQKEIPALGHDWGEWTVIKESTIAKEGTEQRVCKRDSSHTEEKAIPRKEQDSVYRIYGDTRYETSLKVADDFKEKLGTEKFDTVIIACGTNYADALAGSYLSCVLDAPILLTDTRQDHISALQAYIKANLKDGGKIYMLGGAAVVPDSAVTSLNGYETKRLWGQDRYETNISILKEAAVYSSDSEILVCSGTNFPDSLSAAAAGKPILLVRGTLQDSQKNHLKSLNGPTFDIIGGTGAVSDSIKNELKAYGTTVRIEGSTRFETSVNVAKKFFDGPNAAVLAYGQTFPDGLCGGALAHAIGCPLILAGNGKTQFAEAYAHEKGIHYGAVLGGPTLISDESAESIFGWGPVNQDTAVIRNISYELKGGENAPSNPAQYTEGIRLKLADPTYDNHSFCGWYLDPECTQKVTEIDRDSKGDITLYAKWHLAALNITREGLDDMIWSWWYYPQVVSSVSGDVYWGYATQDGHCGVAEYDREAQNVTKTALKLAGADDHNGLALTLLDDGRIMAVYAGGHNTDNEIHVRISDAPGDIRSFRSDTVLESTGKTCYSQIIRSSGRYYIFYRVNNSKWAYRYSEDLSEWSNETIVVTAPMQYYCKFQPTTQDNVIRVLMYSNPSGSAAEIRLGFFDTSDNSIFDGSAFSAGQTVPAEAAKLSALNNSYTSFVTLLEPPAGKTQRLFDCAVTDPGRTEFLYSVFSKKTGSNDSIYYLYDAGSSYEICEGGKPLMDYKYQLGASFVNASQIVAARNVNGTDLVEQYVFYGKTVSLVKQLDSQTGTANARNARPISDVNGRAVLWHNGFYNNSKYTDFNTSARVYIPETDTIIICNSEKRTEILKHSSYIAGALDLEENIAKVNAYADKLYNENVYDDYKTAEFTWSQEHQKRGWLYYNGFMLEAFLERDPLKYSPEILKYYDQHVVQDENSGRYIVWKYTDGSLDWVLPATGMVDLIHQGIAAGERREKYSQAINYVYNMLEHQTVYEDAGRLWQHSERETQIEENGLVTAKRVPTASWSKWNICLDGIYMSNLFLIRMAEAIDAGELVIYAEDGTIVRSSDIWSDIYSRMSFVMEKMRNPKTGLLWHGYSVEDKECNGVTWSRGLGWFAMTLMDAAEKMPDADKKDVLKCYYSSLMTSVVEWQDSESDLWYNVTDRRTDLNRNQPETSGSAMFAYCLLKGYHSGLLEGEEFRDAGIKAFNSLADTRLTFEGLTDTLIKMGCSSVPGHYLNDVFVTNEAKGIAAFIMAAKYANQY